MSLHRLKIAFTTRPRWSDWGLAMGLMAGLSGVVVPLGLWQHWLTPGVAVPWPEAGGLALRVLVIPALTEEGFWRVLMLPHKTERFTPNQRRWVGAAVLGLFVLMHVLSSLTFYPQGFPTFLTPFFLLSATLLGLICTLAYWASGSGWVPVVMHWLVVFAWLMFLGGYDQLRLGH